jgi:hypothetical protein
MLSELDARGPFGSFVPFRISQFAMHLAKSLGNSIEQPREKRAVVQKYRSFCAFGNSDKNFCLRWLFCIGRRRLSVREQGRAADFRECTN